MKSADSRHLLVITIKPHVQDIM